MHSQCAMFFNDVLQVTLKICLFERTTTSLGEAVVMLQLPGLLLNQSYGMVYHRFTTIPPKICELGIDCVFFKNQFVKYLISLIAKMLNYKALKYML